MEHTTTKTVGTTNVAVTALGFGTAPLAGLYEAVGTDQAMDAIVRAVKSGIGYFDTAPLYGSGLAEARLGAALASIGARPTVSTKIGYGFRPAAEPDTFFVGAPQFEAFPDWSEAAVHRSFEQSLERLGVDRVDILFLHDPAPGDLEEVIATGARLARRWQDEGLVGAVGAGMNDAADVIALLERTELDCVLIAGRVSLLDQSALVEMLPLCERRGTSVIGAGVFNSGILANPGANPHFDYAPAAPELVAQARAIQEVCERFNVPLAAAALQYPFRHAAVASVVAGMRSDAEVDENVRLSNLPIAEELWRELADAGLVPHGA